MLNYQRVKIQIYLWQQDTTCPEKSDLTRQKRLCRTAAEGPCFLLRRTFYEASTGKVTGTQCHWGFSSRKKRWFEASIMGI